MNKSEDNRFDIGNDKQIAKKSKNSKDKKLSISWKLAKLRKKLSKSRNSPNFDATEAR